jgi:hypothetical protein
MKRIIIAAALAAGLITANAAAQTPAGHQPGEEAAVLEAFDRFLVAINTQDLEARAALQTADGMSYIAVPAEGGGTRIVSRSNAYWVDPANRLNVQSIDDRYWSPTVLIRGDMASVFAPYDLWIDGARVQCGADFAQMVRQDGRWLIANIMFTIERENCDALLPEDQSTIRPAR